ncbi:MAG TPA: response regulator transcription factor [Microvirga sp.]|nr:response regulator transcription factor [Microvirga sp.]
MDVELRTALVADDDEFFRVALSTILTKQLGFSKVIETASLDEALDRLAEPSKVSVALFDLAMPGVQSPANLRAVRECFPSTIVAVVSGSSRRRDILLALEAGVHGYIPKSLGITELANALRTILGGTIYVPSSLAELPTDDQSTEAGFDALSSRGGPLSLTPRQRDVLQLLVQGKSNKEIARALKLGEGTVKVHMAALFRTLDVSTRSAAAVAGAKLLAAAA